MAITVQARQANGEWHVRNAFIDDNKLVIAGSMKKDDLLRKAQKVCEQWRAYDDGKQLRVHDSEADPKPESRKVATKSETAARALGWRTTQEAHGDGAESYGVVHPRGHWAADWRSAVAFHGALSAA